MQDFHFITENPWEGIKDEIPVTFKIRHAPGFIGGRLWQDETGYRIVSDEKLQGIAPGQFGVVYDEAAKLCIGSGEIRYSTHQSTMPAFIAYFVASWALFTFSFLKIFFRWLFTVWN